MASIADIEKLFKANNELLRKDIKKDIDDANKDVLEAIEGTLSLQQEQIKQLQNKVSEMEAKDQQRNEDELQREIKDRRKNIILYRIEENESSQEKLLDAIVKVLNEAVEENIEARDIDGVYRLGKKRDDGTRRPILIRFVSINLKNSIMKKFQFFKSRNIDIFEDLPKEIRDRRKEILPLLKLIKERGMKASLRADKLNVNGAYWSVPRAQEFIDDPPAEMEVSGSEEEQHGNQQGASQKRDRSSPSRNSPFQQKKKKAPALTNSKKPIKNRGIHSA